MVARAGARTVSRKVRRGANGVDSISSVLPSFFPSSLLSTHPCVCGDDLTRKVQQFMAFGHRFILPVFLVGNCLRFCLDLGKGRARTTVTHQSGSSSTLCRQIATPMAVPYLTKGSRL